MPLLVDGEDAFNDPVYFDASGYYGQSFSYNETPNPWGSTALLKGFDTYKIGLYVDFAFTALSLEGAFIPGPPGDYNGDDTVNAADYTVWRDTLGQNDTGLAADGNGDNEITSADYDIWKQHFGQSGGSGSVGLSPAVVPEPSACGLLVSSLIIAFRFVGRCSLQTRPRQERESGLGRNRTRSNRTDGAPRRLSPRTANCSGAVFLVRPSRTPERCLSKSRKLRRSPRTTEKNLSGHPLIVKIKFWFAASRRRPFLDWMWLHMTARGRAILQVELELAHTMRERSHRVGNLSASASSTRFTATLASLSV
jgi:hypothetical protein